MVNTPKRVSVTPQNAGLLSASTASFHSPPPFFLRRLRAVGFLFPREEVRRPLRPELLEEDDLALLRLVLLDVVRLAMMEDA
ncbi:MAG: hypothetical protein GXP42_02250 [Chloroflexi bacterium]|nr:hypothetical protein [Chloroflexota bacterium]